MAFASDRSPSTKARGSGERFTSIGVKYTASASARSGLRLTSQISSRSRRSSNRASKLSRRP